MTPNYGGNAYRTLRPADLREPNGLAVVFEDFLVKGGGALASGFADFSWEECRGAVAFHLELPATRGRFRGLRVL